MYCWGWVTGSGTPMEPPDGVFTSISSGWAHICGVKRDGTIACSGSNEHGQANPPAGKFTSVSAGSWHTCAVRTDGAQVCWGARVRNLTAESLARKRRMSTAVIR